ncbi:hypothetical protein A3K29_05695 [Candidatus Collierbacteria bacterium RIFOXYB2_FULL_46_14]|uniref:Uncharacterized protein n=1 Tax=Candidatus Collierbacteria bacterium GW2011_GWA2_46_26 TaxID=1618381 RepID=A0A0G1RRL5_9BACT|nr:MAG: hypothetical protein UX47_C0009G0020 [Candidatus Collierbacteria bacterium GW2011_GWA2_46_26]OGD73582.1 MAG: hypothetical protein A3K29_05695 [Candidatus Collierbacteria bacterium RIFOXYB2_FULL_46_14]OGD76624.1 MAG: hypothetical protein A3K43_05695 [Candidatus Collierbacteria bacterium RIFOXYA2_FULL_46_20]OGD77960.1 MAG: hypothetical protein A3K39_05695 [Candidatus Collierbacteria bacterium RIFOXYC2_FULL_43_15]OGD79984.1 MAG: hypothetical protein A2320_00125 [Pseudomonadales bacterium G
MEPKFEKDVKYRLTREVDACVVDGQNCVLQNDIDLNAETVLTFVEANEDGFVFSNEEGTNYRLHADDIDAVEEA